jgi:hypothetical protein
MIKDFQLKRVIFNIVKNFQDLCDVPLMETSYKF